MKLYSKATRWMIAFATAFAVVSAAAYAKPKASAKKGTAKTAQKVEEKKPENPVSSLESAAIKLVGKKLGFWVSGIAKISNYAYVEREDTSNRIMCLLTMTFNTNCFFEGESKENVQLVHVKREDDSVEVNEVEKIDPAAGGIYVLFVPESIYVLDFDAGSHIRYGGRR